MQGSINHGFALSPTLGGQAAIAARSQPSSERRPVPEPPADAKALEFKGLAAWLAMQTVSSWCKHYSICQVGSTRVRWSLRPKHPCYCCNVLFFSRLRQCPRPWHVLCFFGRFNGRRLPIVVAVYRRGSIDEGLHRIPTLPREDARFRRRLAEKPTNRRSEPTWARHETFFSPTTGGNHCGKADGV
jgi:hypothetical protein